MWVVMPVMGNPVLTRTAISDVLRQTLPVQLLIVNQACPDEFRWELEKIAEEDDRVFVWSHEPTLPALSSVWNRALQMIWATGETRAWLVNNDLRLHPMTLATLDKALTQHEAWFVSAVGVGTEAEALGWDGTLGEGHGGPDFSCFLLSKEGHDAYPFDEGFIPAYCEDLDTHRRYLLGGDGEKIFSVPVPYWHIDGGSGTLKAMTTEERDKHQDRIRTQSRAHYQKKWGGPVNRERYTIPFVAESGQDHVTTPELQHGLPQTAPSDPV